jgi:Flp pilus assembly protein TadG
MKKSMSKGSALLELAFVIPVFVALYVFTIEYSHYSQQSLAVNKAISSTAKFVGVSCGQQELDPKDAFDAALGPFIGKIPKDNLKVTRKGNKNEYYYVATITYQPTMSKSVLGAFIPPEINATGIGYCDCGNACGV